MPFPNPMEAGLQETGGREPFNKISLPGPDLFGLGGPGLHRSRLLRYGLYPEVKDLVMKVRFLVVVTALIGFYILSLFPDILSDPGRPAHQERGMLKTGCSAIQVARKQGTITAFDPEGWLSVDLGGFEGLKMANRLIGNGFRR